MTTYSFIVYPCNGPNLWPPLQTPVMLPPIMRKAHGRPKKARNKKNDESTKRPNLARQSRSVVCKNCRTIGHNRRACKGKTSTDRIIPKEGNKILFDFHKCCKNCRTIGHNRRTCKGKTSADITIPKGGNKVLLTSISAVNFIYRRFLLHLPFLSFWLYILTELEETIAMSHPCCSKETKNWSKHKSDHICRTSKRWQHQ